MVEDTAPGKVRYPYQMGDAATSVDLTAAAARAYGEDLIDEAKHSADTSGVTVPYTTISGQSVPVSPPTPEREREIGLELLRLADDEDAPASGALARSGEVPPPS